MTITPHCMGTEFPKRDTDSPAVNWVSVDLNIVLPEPQKNQYPILSAVAEEQRVKDKTSG